MTVPGTDLLAEALADCQVVNDTDYVNATNTSVALLHIETRSSAGTGLIDVGDEESDGVVFVSHVLPPAAAHLTPPITARTNETNALLNQTPIMSTLENPSAVQLRRVSPLGEVNLDDSLAVLGATNTSGVPTSLELPITVTNPAIAHRVTAPIAEIVQYSLTLDEEEVCRASEITVPGTDLLAEALADCQVVNDTDYVNATNTSVALLHIETRSSAGTGLIDVGDEESDGVVFVSHVLPPAAAHLTPPITARTNETNALLNQTPIMSTLENPSAVQLRRVSPLGEVNLDDSLAVLGATNTSGVPTSLELPITVTNPAIAHRVTAPIAEIVQLAPFQ
ncbi:uncharacterized protein LOC117591315 [Drosophila guanche]|uniref:uncharacterized protein LOC117591315 n=1 Tax=Drosophila guanche TaxID=7266 RepID=UPI001470F80E|nr:uncharacterized protein LOC117591315 [Drosophila guanche]